MIIFDTEVVELSKPVYQKVKSGKYIPTTLEENNGVVSVYRNDQCYYEDIWYSTGCSYPIFTSFCLSRAKRYFTSVEFFSNREGKEHV
jgi:hypothetical protein